MIGESPGSPLGRATRIDRIETAIKDLAGAVEDGQRILTTARETARAEEEVRSKERGTTRGCRCTRPRNWPWPSGYCFQESQTNGRRKRFTPKRPTAWRGPRGAKRTTGSRFWPHAPWRTFRLDPEHLGVRPARGTRVELFCRRSRSTSITFPGEPRAITRAAGRVQGPRYRAARSRSRRCVSGISAQVNP